LLRDEDVAVAGHVTFAPSVCEWARALIAGGRALQGMTEAKAADRLMTYGLNELTPPATTSELVKFGRTLVGGFALLLWAGAVLCFTAFIIQWVQMNGNDVPQDNVSSTHTATAVLMSWANLRDLR